MVKIKGPIMSVQASGGLANAMVFATNKGRAYARKLTTPANPKSGMQVGSRAMWKYLAQLWTTLHVSYQNTFNDLAQALTCSPFNAFVQHNMKRWRRFHAPSRTLAGVPGETPGTFDTFVATGGPRHVKLTIITDPIFDGFNVMIFRSPTAAYDTAIGNCIAVIPVESTAEHIYLDGQLAPGTYYYDARSCTAGGVLGPEDGEQAGTAT